MKYGNIRYGIFLERPNRFIARVLVDGVPETVHVKNTGRCREILHQGASVILEKAGHTGRKTPYSLIAAYKGKMLVNIDYQAPNQVVYEALCRGMPPEFGNVTRIIKEVGYGNSRFDLYYENESEKGFIEVKGVTLERDETALFPDAPTDHGAKHLLELAEVVESGYTGCVFFLIQMRGPFCFRPNTTMDPGFSEALRRACASGVKIMAYDSMVTEDGISMGSPLPLAI